MTLGCTVRRKSTEYPSRSDSKFYKSCTRHKGQESKVSSTTARYHHKYPQVDYISHVDNTLPYWDYNVEAKMRDPSQSIIWSKVGNTGALVACTSFSPKPCLETTPSLTK